MSTRARATNAALARPTAPARTAQRPLVPAEYTFAVIALVAGILFVFANPPWQANDEDRHFYNAYFYSIGQSGMQQSGERIGGKLPSSLVESASIFQGIAFSPTVKLSRIKVAELSLIPLMESRTTFYDNPNWGVNPVGYLPYIAGISLGRVVNSNPVHLLWSARIAGLLAYVAIVFVAIRLIPAHKWVLFAVALTPMALYQASSVTYDTLCNALSWLIVSMVVRFALREQSVSARELALFVVVAIVQRYAKDGYYLLPFLLFAVPQRHLGSLAKVIALFVVVCVIELLPLLTWDVYVSSLNLRARALLQKDFVFDTGKQLDFYGHQPFAMLWYLLLNVAVQGKEWIIGTVGRFGYAYAPLPQYVAFGYGLALLALSVLDWSPARAFNARERIVIAIVALASIALIVVGTFVRGTPVGARVILGLQGRYFLPLLPLLLLVNYKLCFGSLASERWKSLIVPICSIAVLAYALHFIDTWFFYR